MQREAMLEGLFELARERQPLKIMRGPYRVLSDRSAHLRCSHDDTSLPIERSLLGTLLERRCSSACKPKLDEVANQTGRRFDFAEQRRMHNTSCASLCCRYPGVLRADAARRIQVGAAEDGGDDPHRGQMGGQRRSNHADLRPERRKYDLKSERSAQRSSRCECERCSSIGSARVTDLCACQSCYRRRTATITRPKNKRGSVGLIRHGDCRVISADNYDRPHRSALAYVYIRVRVCAYATSSGGSNQSRSTCRF